MGVLNGVLAAISSLGNHRNAKSLALETLAEFKKVGVEPSLASYYFVLIIHCKESKISSAFGISALLIS